MQHTVNISYQSAAMKLREVLANPQTQPRPAAALQGIAIELRELLKHLRLVLYRNTYNAYIHTYTDKTPLTTKKAMNSEVAPIPESRTSIRRKLFATVKVSAEKPAMLSGERASRCCRSCCWRSTGQTRKRIVTSPPSGVNFTALVMRLRMICSTRNLSMNRTKGGRGGAGDSTAACNTGPPSCCWVSITGE